MYSTYFKLVQNLYLLCSLISQTNVQFYSLHITRREMFLQNRSCALTKKYYRLGTTQLSSRSSPQSQSCYAMQATKHIDALHSWFRFEVCKLKRTCKQHLLQFSQIFGLYIFVTCQQFQKREGKNLLAFSSYKQYENL